MKGLREVGGTAPQVGTDPHSDSVLGTLQPSSTRTVSQELCSVQALLRFLSLLFLVEGSSEHQKSPFYWVTCSRAALVAVLNSLAPAGLPLLFIHSVLPISFHLGVERWSNKYISVLLFPKDAFSHYF